MTEVRHIPNWKYFLSTGSVSLTARAFRYNANKGNPTILADLPLKIFAVLRQSEFTQIVGYARKNTACRGRVFC